MKRERFVKRRAFPCPQPIGFEIERLIKPHLQSQGFCQARMILDWASIVGDFLARETQPEKIYFPRGERRHGKLILRVTGAVATEVQHMTPQFLERINRYFGYPALSEIVLKQGLDRPRSQPPAPKPRHDLAPAGAPSCLPPSLQETLEGIEDPDLRDVLRRLGSYISSL